jgi:hypothetical protein
MYFNFQCKKLVMYRRYVHSEPKKSQKIQRKLLCVSFWRYGIPYMQKVTEFQEITTRNSAEFRRNFSQFRTEYGIDESKKTDGIQCGRNSVDTLVLGTVAGTVTGSEGTPCYM